MIASIGAETTVRSITVVRSSCRIWVHHVTLAVCWSLPVYPQHRTWLCTAITDAMCQQKTFADSFDHLVGAYEERWRDSEAKRFGGSHVDGEVEMRGALER